MIPSRFLSILPLIALPLLVVPSPSSAAPLPLPTSVSPDAAPPTPNTLSPTPLPTAVLPDGLGVNIHFTDPRPGEMKMLAAGGFKWVRMDFAWSSIEKEKGVYDFSAYDRLLTTLAPYHIRAVFILDYGNDLYNKGESPRTEEGRQAFARWAAAAARHFAGRGVLWEMFNEPNISFWHPHPDVQEYIPLALAVGKALHDATPTETYIGPATSTLDFPFLEACFKAGLLQYWMAVSVHPYRGGGPETAAAEFRRLRLLIRRYAPPGKSIPIISGEWGYASPGGPTDEQRQGKMLPRQWLSNLSNNIALSIWYDWHEDGLSPTDPEHHFGTVHNPYHEGGDPVYDPKPSYIAAKTLTSVLDGFHFSKRLWTGSPDDYVLLFSKGRDVRLAVWTTSHTPHKIPLTSEFGAFGATDHLGAPAGWINAPRISTGLPRDLTDAPLYLIPRKSNDFLRIAAAWERAPLEIMAQAPAQTTISLSLRNPLDTPITINTGTGRVLINPHAIHFFTQTVDVTQSAAPIPVLLNLDVLGLGIVTQRTEIIVTNPLNVTLLPLEGTSLPVHIENPSGNAFTGSVNLNGLRSGKEWAVHLPLHLAPGQVEATLHATLPETGSADYNAFVDLEDDKGKLVLSAPSTRFHLIDDFSRYPGSGQPGSYKAIPDGDPKVASDQELTLNVPPDNPTPSHAGALRLTYRFDAGWKFVRVITGRTDFNTIEGKPRALGVWVFGDGQGNSPRMRFTDSSGQTFQPAAPDITWKGWRYLSFPMDGKEGGSWGGAQDGVIHYPIHLDTLFLLDGNRKATHGEIYLSAPTWIW